MSQIFFFFLFILYTCLIYLKNWNFFLKDGFYQINWSASNMISDEGGRGLSHFLFFSDMGGRGGKPISNFWLIRVGGGIWTPPPIFGWHTMWPTPKCPKVAKKGQKVQQRQRHPHVIYLASQTSMSQCLSALNCLNVKKKVSKSPIDFKKCKKVPGPGPGGRPGRQDQVSTPGPAHNYRAGKVNRL